MKALTTICFVLLLAQNAFAYSDNFILQNLTLDRDLPWYQVSTNTRAGEIFSGFRSTIHIDFEYRDVSYLLYETENECGLAYNDYPITGRFFATSTPQYDNYYYYCPKNKTILTVEGEYFVPTTSILLPEELPQFNETKFYTNGQNDGIVYILGIVYQIIQNDVNNAAFNYTESYIIEFDGNNNTVIDYTLIYGSNGGTITSIAIIGNDVYGIAESVEEYYKSIVLYQGTLGYHEFSTKLDEWSSQQLAVYPELQVTNDREWIVYSSNTTLKAIYLQKSTTIYSLPASSSLLQFTNLGETLSYYIPLFFRCSNVSASVFVYMGPNVTQYSLSTTKGFVAIKSFAASAGANAYDMFARRIFYFQDTSANEWIMVSAGERAPSINIINFSQGRLVQAVPSLEANATQYNISNNNYIYIARNGIYTLNSNWEYMSFQYFANFGRTQDSTSKDCFSLITSKSGNCYLNLWNSTSNISTQFLLPTGSCIPDKTFYTSYNPKFPNVIQMFTGPLFTPIIGHLVSQISE